MTLRTARSRQRGIATNELAMSAVVILIVSVIVVRGFAAKTEHSLECVTHAARIGEGASPQGLTCPVSKSPFVQPVCPDSDRHLKWPPRFDRDRAQQDLPAPPQGATLEIGRKGSYIAARQNGATVMVDVRPRIWWRYLAGPILQVLCVLLLLSFFVQLNPKDRPPAGVIVVALIAALLSAWGLWVTVPTVQGSHAFQFDPAAGGVIRHRYLFGKELAPEVFDARGLAFVRSRQRPESWSLVLAVRGSSAVELVDGLAEEDAVLGSWLKARFPR